MTDQTRGTSSGPSAVPPEWGVPSGSESRLPALAAVVVAIVLYETLPAKLNVEPGRALPMLEAALIIALLLAGRTTIKPESRNVRWLSLTLIGVINAANAASLVLLVHALIGSDPRMQGRPLIFAAISIWITAVLVFALWYWELDRGGPHARTTADHREPDFLFPQMTTPRSAPHMWSPSFLDYLYVSFTNQTAFSPTDTMPLTVRAKAIMLAQGVVSIVTIVLVAARAVNILT